LAEKGDVALSLAQAPSSLIIKMDKEKLKMALVGLVDNAIRYNRPGGGVDITIDQSGRNAVVGIKDTGMGVAAKEKERIFSKFFRGERAIKINVAGFGLGLYIAKIIIEKHGGQIDLETEEGRGASFFVILPLK
jgi:two-component system, OmpR family, phosphate regulon sensor histidine kinase PhoR